MSRRVGTAALVVVFAVITFASCVRVMPPSVPAVTSTGVHFEVSFPDATSVAVAGDFNQWSTTSHPLARNSSGIWSTVVSLPPGEHAFMYVVDDTRWTTPAQAEVYVDDGFGSKNGVVVVR